MPIYNFFRIFFKLFSLILFFGLVIFTIYLLWTGVDFGTATGEIWFDHHVESLNLAQVIIERYIYHPLWFDFFVPYVLQQAAFVVFPIILLVSGIFAYLMHKIA